MIEQFFRPDSVEQALELKRRYQDEAVWFAGGSKLNATPVSYTHLKPSDFSFASAIRRSSISSACVSLRS